jgi:hypothetical protein
MQTAQGPVRPEAETSGSVQNATRLPHRPRYTVTSSDNGIIAFEGRTFIAFYVDDLLIVDPDMTRIGAQMEALTKTFQMTDLGQCQCHLGIRIRRNRPDETIYLDQTGYIDKILVKFNMTNCPTNQLPMAASVKLQKPEPDWVCHIGDRLAYPSMVGVLMYLMLGTGPDLAFAVSCVARYSSQPQRGSHGRRQDELPVSTRQPSPVSLLHGRPQASIWLHRHRLGGG